MFMFVPSISVKIPSTSAAEGFTLAIFRLRLKIFCSDAGIRLFDTKKAAMPSSTEKTNVLLIARKKETPEAFMAANS